MGVVASANVAAAVADAHRREWGFVLAATVPVIGDLGLAEEAVQDAYARALETWGSRGIPANAGAWLTTAARRRALDIHRRAATALRALPKLAEQADATTPDPFDLEDIPDDRLRLIFTCCHPSLALEAQVALTLRLLCGLSTADVARAFLVPEATMAARITRAKKKIKTARIPYRVPPLEELPGRVRAVLSVIHLVFTTGQTAPTGEELMRHDLAERGLELARLLRVLLPDNPDVGGLLALILLTDARRDARLDEHGQLVLLRDQDRLRWDRQFIDEGARLLRESLRLQAPSRFTIMAAIAAVHDQSPSWPETDWAEIVGLYDLLFEVWPTPVVSLNRAIAIGFALGPKEGLTELDRLTGEPQLAHYGYLSSARAEFLAQLGRTTAAREAYEEALLLTGNGVERDFLAARLDQLGL
ncbi:RNA polymerase sigma factor [Paenarthrobacter sp. NPDC089714]|uniref:RNA polymerase sigma factor n=1 Tax=Paenarthrobacter sp. NPDC089714 TaxID=3364377 RepID=UPI0038028267